VVRVGVCLSGDLSILPTVNVTSPESVTQSAMQKVLADQRVLSDIQTVVLSTLGSSIQNSSDPVSAVHTSLSMGVDFTPGMNFAKDINKLFHSTVHANARAKPFTMVVSLGRASFWLDEESVAIALEATIGGLCGSLKFQFISERVFSFKVASKKVGFHIVNMRWFNCDKFKCFFHLWSDGGPNWRREFALGQKECAQECILVSPSKRTVQLGIAAMKKAAPKPAVKHTSATNRSLKLAPIIQYEACKGYSHIDISPSEKTWPYLTKTIPSIPFWYNGYMVSFGRCG
jgi:hypothetical protein